jgi:uncharacterized protein
VTETTEKVALPRCPTCTKTLAAEPSERRYRPFCSKRCQQIDLNRWLSGAYAIPSNDIVPMNENTAPEHDE